MDTDAREALLMVWTDIAPEVEDEFNDWYNREHVRERVDVPGFIRARRFAALSGSPRYIALYEAQSTQVLQSEPYLAFKRVRDERTLRYTRLFRNTIKATGEVVLRAGRGEGAFLVVLPVTTAPARDDALTGWLRDELFPRLVDSPGIAAATYAAHSSALRGTASPLDVRTGDRHVDGVLLVEATSERGMRDAVAALDPRALEHRAARPHLVEHPSTFRVLYTLHA